MRSIVPALFNDTHCFVVNSALAPLQMLMLTCNENHVIIRMGETKKCSLLLFIRQSSKIIVSFGAQHCTANERASNSNSAPEGKRVRESTIKEKAREHTHTPHHTTDRKRVEYRHENMLIDWSFVVWPEHQDTKIHREREHSNDCFQLILSRLCWLAFLGAFHFQMKLMHVHLQYKTIEHE